jgi:hypothetical protein
VRAISILLCQLNHGILNNIKGSVVVTHGIYRLLKGPFLNATEKVR